MNVTDNNSKIGPFTRPVLKRTGTNTSNLLSDQNISQLFRLKSMIATKKRGSSDIRRQPDGRIEPSFLQGNLLDSLFSIRVKAAVLNQKGTFEGCLSKQEILENYVGVREAQEDLSNLKTDETIAFISEYDGYLRPRIIRRNQLKILQQRKAQQPKTGNEKGLKIAKLNLFSNITSNFEIQRDYSINLEARHKLHNALMFSRANNNIPVTITKQEDLKDKVQTFILLWMRENLGLQRGKIQPLIDSIAKRKDFFEKNPELFQLVLNTVLKKPDLYKRVTDYLFSKLKAPDLLNKGNSTGKAPLITLEEPGSQTSRSLNNKVLVRSSSGRRILVTKGVQELDDKKEAMKRSISQISKSFLNVAKPLPFTKLEPFKQQMELPVETKDRGSSKKGFYGHLRGINKLFATGNSRNSNTEEVKKPCSFYQSNLHLIQALVKQYGGVQSLNRTVLNRFKAKIPEEQHGLIMEVCRWLGIRLTVSEDNESDLGWVAVLLYLHEATRLQRARGVGSLNRHHHRYFLELLEEQRARRRIFLQLHAQRRAEIVHALSWIVYYQQDREVYFNLSSGEVSTRLRQLDQETLVRFYSYPI